MWYQLRACPTRSEHMPIRVLGETNRARKNRLMVSWSVFLGIGSALDYWLVLPQSLTIFLEYTLIRQYSMCWCRCMHEGRLRVNKGGAAKGTARTYRKDEDALCVTTQCHSQPSKSKIWYTYSHDQRVFQFLNRNEECWSHPQRFISTLRNKDCIRSLFAPYSLAKNRSLVTLSITGTLH